MKLHELVDALAESGRAIKNLAQLAAPEEFMLPIYLELYRGGVQVARVSPITAMTPADVEPIMKTATGAFEADMVGVIYETVMVPTDEWQISTQHPITGAPLTLAALQSLLQVDGHRTGLMVEALVTAGANRAGDFRVRVDWYRPDGDGDRLEWFTAPEPLDQELEYGDSAMVEAMRAAMAAETMQQAFAQLMGVAGSLDDRGGEQLTQERIDVMTAVWLQRVRNCRVQLMGDADRAEELRRWALTDWQWEGEGLPQ